VSLLWSEWVYELPKINTVRLIIWDIWLIWSLFNPHSLSWRRVKYYSCAICCIRSDRDDITHSSTDTDTASYGIHWICLVFNGVPLNDVLGCNVDDFDDFLTIFDSIRLVPAIILFNLLQFKNTI
jgi:hypothetical protein